MNVGLIFRGKVINPLKVRNPVLKLFYSTPIKEVTVRHTR